MSSKSTQAVALISMVLMFGLALVWILSGALIPGQQSAQTGGVSFVGGIRIAPRIVPLTVAMAVAVVIAVAELLLHRKKR